MTSIALTSKQSYEHPALLKEDAVTTALVSVAKLLGRRTSQVVEPYGVTTQQYNVLRILREARGEPITPTEMVERMIDYTPGMTRLLDRLEAKGLVTRDRCRDDRRLVYCYATEAGLELLTKLDPMVDALNQKVMSPLSDHELDQLERLLSKLQDQTHDQTADGPISDTSDEGGKL